MARTGARSSQYAGFGAASTPASSRLCSGLQATRRWMRARRATGWWTSRGPWARLAPRTLHAASSLTDTNGSQVVPFYLQPTLGGPDTLRGFRFDRFYGNNSTMATAEYRWDASPILQMVAFFDGGKVFNNWQQWNFHDIQTDVGFGFRFRGRAATNVFSFDTGFSHEGFQIWFGMNNALQSRAQ